MHKILRLTLCLSLMLSSYVSAAELPSSFADIVEKASPAVVNISTTQKVEKRKRVDLNELPDNPFDFFEFFDREMNRQRPRKATFLGSGFIIDSSGYIVTNYHVIADAEQVTVTLDGEAGETFKAKIIGKDPKTDLALLKIEAKKPLPFVNFGDATKARVGDWILVIGNPFGLNNTASAGIISGKARYLNNNQYDDYIQTDASINKGNSGGPMFNLQGEVIGVNTIILSTSGGSIGIGFAVPSTIVKSVVEQLKTKGEIVRGWLGVKIQTIDEIIQKSLALKDNKGALVAEVMKDSPADKAGIEIGDVITKFDGLEVTNMNKLPRMVADVPVNKKVELELLRKGQLIKLNVLIERPKGDPYSEGKEDGEEADAAGKGDKVILGLRVSNIEKGLISRFKLDSAITGIVVLGIDKDSILAGLGINPGDVIQQINQIPIKSIKDFDAAVKTIQKNKDKKAVLLLKQRGENRFLGFDLEE